MDYHCRCTKVHVHVICGTSFSIELAAHSNAIFDISWKPGGEHIVRQGQNAPKEYTSLTILYSSCKETYI